MGGGHFFAQIYLIPELPPFDPIPPPFPRVGKGSAGTTRPLGAMAPRCGGDEKDPDGVSTVRVNKTRKYFVDLQ